MNTPDSKSNIPAFAFTVLKLHGRIFIKEQYRDQCMDDHIEVFNNNVRKHGIKDARSMLMMSALTTVSESLVIATLSLAEAAALIERVLKLIGK